MLSNLLKSVSKLCPHSSRKLILLPLATLGILGFLINTHVSTLGFIDFAAHARGKYHLDDLIQNNSNREEWQAYKLFISSGGICYPKSNVVFLKTHKCAGSSIQNLLLRFGDTHKLNFVLPTSGNYLGHPAPFSRTMVGPPRTFTFNILAHHTRLDYREIRYVMPHNSVYITIVRDPIQIFESSYSYYSFDKLFKCDIHKFISYLPRFTDKFIKRRFRGKFGANQMFFDLGGDTSIFANESKIKEYIDKLESWFHLVLVAERMDESLILLRHLLCWDIDDVVVFKLNARNPKFKSNLSEVEKEKLLKLNHADALLYERFLDKFEKEIDAFGRERMATETAELRRRTDDWYELCVEGEQPHTKPEGKPKHYYNPRVMMFETKKNTTNSTCKSMTIEELPYTEYLRQRQMATFPLSFVTVAPKWNKTKLSLRKHLKLRTILPKS